jgi:DNA repair protein RadA
MTKDKFDLSNIKGLGGATKKKFEDVGIDNIMDLLVRSPNEIKDLSGMKIDTVNKYVDLAREYLTENDIISKDFITGSQVLELRQTLGKISTGSNALDSLFEGGVEEKALTEVYGEFGSGKTQFCHTLAVMVQKPRGEGGLDGKVLYIDTEGTFRPERIVTISQERGMDPVKANDNIQVVKAHNSSHLLLIMQEVGKLVKENNIKLIIVDSLIGLYRAEFLGRGTLSERQQKLSTFIHTLLRTVEIYNIVGVCTNQVMASPDVMFGDPIKAVGGNIVAHTSTYRVYFKKAGKKKIARMVDSPHHATSEVVFSLGAAGVTDPEEEKIDE